VAVVAKHKQCTLPAGTEGADDGNPHCWDRIRRCDAKEAHPDDGPGYTPACGACEGIGGPAWGDENDQIALPKCTPLSPPGVNDTQPVHPSWAMMGGNGKFTIENDRFIMIGKKTDPFCFSFFPSNNSIGNQCYRRQTGTFQVDMSKEEKSVRYDLNLHIPWPSDRFSLFGNISTTIFHHGPNMWVVNNLYNLMHQCVCIQPLSSAGTGGKRNPDPIFPVMHNWTDHLSWFARERMEIEYGVGEMDVDHWTYGPHHAWTPVGSSDIVRMWQPYNGFEVFEPGSIKPGVINEEDFAGMVPPPMCKKEGGALARITCTDDGFPVDRDGGQQEVPAQASDMQRARTKVPRSSHKGIGFRNMAETLNGFVREYKNVKECSEWSTHELQRFQALMMMLRSSELNNVYSSSDDSRALRGDEQEHGERWERLNDLAQSLGEEDMQRDGHCHEAVMWFVHHIPESLRNSVAQTMAIPLLPYTQHECTGKKHEICDEYVKQVSCQDCHRDADIPALTV